MLPGKTRVVEAVRVRSDAEITSPTVALPLRYFNRILSDRITILLLHGTLESVSRS